jgi:hypothetical protein
MISFLTRHWKSIGAVLVFLFAGIGIYILEIIPQISEFFRGPKIVVVPQINTVSDITFQEPNTVEQYEGDYAQLLREFMWCHIVETTPIFAYYIENGYLSSDELNKMRAKRDQIFKQFEETLANVPIAVRIKNNGYRATTIESVAIYIPSIGKMGPMGAKFENVKRYIEHSKVDDLDYIVQIRVALLMHGEIIDLLTKLSAQMPDSFRDSAFDAAKTQLEAAPFITFDSKGTVIVTDQFGTQYSGTFDLRPISDLLEKAKPPESKENDSRQNTPAKSR